MSEETKTVAELAAETKAAFETKLDAVRAIAEDVKGKAEAGEAIGNTAKELADQAIIGMNEAKARLDELEQKMARQRENETEEFKSVGEQFTDNEDVKAFLANGSNAPKSARVGAEIEQKAIISSLTTVAAGSVGGAIVPQRLPGVVPIAQRPLRVRDLLMQGRTNSNAIQYVQETGFTNAAATVSETAGTTKPQSDIQMALVTSNVTTVAHWVQARARSSTMCRCCSPTSTSACFTACVTLRTTSCSTAPARALT
jgi:HK97 family phage major capsid protein